MHLGDRSEEVGLGEIWFAFDDLVEVLDGKDIVLKIEGVPADGSDAVGVELGLYWIKAYSAQNTNYYVSNPFQAFNCYLQPA